MATTPTNLPVPSESPIDLKYNAGKIDEFVTSLALQYIDRFGNAHYTIEGLRWLAQQAIAQYGWILIDSFQVGADITLPNQALRDEDTGEFYRWDGALPKHVDTGSTPASSGGVGIGAWVGIGDASLRALLSSASGTDYVSRGSQTLSEILDGITTSVEKGDSSDYKKRNAKALGTAQKKLSASEPITIVCVGDSITAGHDVTSSDRIPSTTGNPFTVAPIQYPSRISDNINGLTASSGTVINRGYSGDTARLSFNRWTTNPGADVAHIMLGINDSRGSNGATFDEYADYMERIIRRYIDWGCGVVIHTATAVRYNNENWKSAYYTQYMRTLAAVYGCPVFESEGVLQYCDYSSVYSDETHFNKSGYAKYGDAVTAFIFAGGWVGQYRNISSYTAQQPGRSSEGIGFFGKGHTLSTNLSSSYALNGSIAALPVGTASMTFAFFMDTEFANLYLVGSLDGGVTIAPSRPVNTAEGLSPYNRFQLKRDYNKQIFETAPYVTAQRANSAGSKSFAGALVGRGWKLVSVAVDGTKTSPAYLNYMIVEPVSADKILQSPDLKYFDGITPHKGVDTVSILKKPYYSRSTPSASLPAAEALTSIRMPLPDSMYGHVSANLFFDSETIELTIKTVGSTDTGALANGITKVTIYRDSATTFSWLVSAKTAAGCIEPTSVSVSKSAIDGTGLTAGWPGVNEVGWLNIGFTNATTAYFSIEIRTASMSGSPTTWLC